MAYARQHHPRGSAASLAQGLGWFSIALGAAEVLAPHALTRALGMRGQERLVAAYGLREIATGIGILSSRDPTPWIWGRVGGDALDLATLAPALERHNPQRGGAAIATAAVLGVTMLDVICGWALGEQRQEARRAPARDYGHRSGLPRPPEAMRGAARDFEVPRDFRIPEPLRPWKAA
jgi:hypothetical protein